MEKVKGSEYFPNALYTGLTVHSSPGLKIIIVCGILRILKRVFQKWREHDNYAVHVFSTAGSSLCAAGNTHARMHACIHTEGVKTERACRGYIIDADSCRRASVLLLMLGSLTDWPRLQ